MRRRTVVILVGFLAVGGLGASFVAVFRPFEPGPRYKGMPVSYWKRVVKEDIGGHPQSLTTRIQTLLGLRAKSGTPAIFRFDPEAAPVVLHLRICGDNAVQDSISQVFLSTLITSPPGQGITAEFANAVVAELHNENRWIRRAAIEQLAFCWDIPRTETIAGLTGSLEDPDEAVRFLAARQLGRVGPQAAPAVPSLIRLLNDEGVREIAAEALRQIDPAAAKRAGVK